MRRLFFVFFLVLSFHQTVSATVQSTTGSTKITSVSVDWSPLARRAGVMIRVEDEVTGGAPCRTVHDRYINFTGEPYDVITSTASLAASTDKRVILQGSGRCDIYGMEYVRKIVIIAD